MSRFYTIGCIFFTFVNFASILLLYHHYQNYIIVVPSSSASRESPKYKPITIQTGNGSYIGFRQKFNNKNVNTFLGIPYALPPENELRFKSPVSYELNGQKIVTNQWPKPCLQPDNHLQLNNYQFSEDCLYLNVWTPKKGSGGKDQLPVLVIIHTGAFLFGSASEKTYNGLALSQMSNTVVVTFNYRLNLFGFYYDSENPEVVSNAGMLDQVFALKWVKENVLYFGGDPERITLIGQSSAGLAAGMHITSPMSKSLFSQALIMSGSPMQTSALNSPKHVQQFWNNYAKLFNCTGTRTQKAECLMEKVDRNRNSLIRMETVKLLSEDRLFVNAPIVADGDFQPRTQTELLNSMENYKKTENLVLLFGYTDDEGSWIASIDDKEKFGPKAQPNFTSSDAKDALEDFTKKMKPTKNIKDSNHLKSHYLGTLLESQVESDKENPQILSRLVSEVLADHYINCPSNIFAQKLMEKNVKVYQYYWNYKGDPKTSAFWSTFSKVWCGEWMGTCHSFEMFALFGQPFLEHGNFNDDDRIVSKKLIDMVTYFAHKRKLFWPEFSETSKPFYVIDSSMSEHKFGSNLKEKECSRIWYDYII